MMTIKAVQSHLLKFLLELNKKDFSSLFEKARILHYYKHKIDFVAEFFMDEKELFKTNFENKSIICRYTSACTNENCSLYNGCANQKFMLMRSEREKETLDVETRAVLAWKLIDRRHGDENAKIFMALVMALDNDDVEECLEEAKTIKGTIKAFCFKEFLGIQVTPIGDME